MKKILNKKHKINRISNKISHVLIAFFTCFILVGIIAEWNTDFFRAKFHEGDIVLSSIYAPFDFKIKGDVDNKATEAVKKEAMETVLPVYSIDNSVKEAVLNKVTSFFNAIEPLNSYIGAQEERILKIRTTGESCGIPFPVASSIFELNDPKSFLTETVNSIEYIMSAGIIPTPELSKLDKDLVKTVVLIDKSKNVEQKKNLEELWEFSGIRKKAELLSASIKDRKEKALLVDLMSAVLSPNISYQEQETDYRRQAAAAKIKPIYNMIDVKKNELILSKGERISKEHMAKLEAIEQRDLPSIKIASFFGIALLVGLFMLFIVLYIEFYEPDLIVGNK